MHYLLRIQQIARCSTFVKYESKEPENSLLYSDSLNVCHKWMQIQVISRVVTSWSLLKLSESNDNNRHSSKIREEYKSRAIKNVER